MVSNFTITKSDRKKYKKNAMDQVNLVEEFLHDPTYKTELCITFTSTGFCKYGNRCRFAHGKNELFDKSAILPKFKIYPCNSFYKFGY